MIVYIAAVAGMCTLVVTWAIGLNSDVGGLIALGMVCLGIFIQMMSRALSGDE
jgi:hypothetical protein